MGYIEPQRVGAVAAAATAPAATGGNISQVAARAGPFDRKRHKAFRQIYRGGAEACAPAAGDDVGAAAAVRDDDGEACGASSNGASTK